MHDARNNGESPHAETMSYKEMAEDVVCFLDNNGLERIMLLGHSMGGKTAMQVALRFPERVSRLIVVDIAPVQYEHLQKNLKLIRAMQELSLPKKMTRRRCFTSSALSQRPPGSHQIFRMGPYSGIAPVMFGRLMRSFTRTTPFQWLNSGLMALIPCTLWRINLMSCGVSKIRRPMP